MNDPSTGNQKGRPKTAPGANPSSSSASGSGSGSGSAHGATNGLSAGPSAPPSSRSSPTSTGLSSASINGHSLGHTQPVRRVSSAGDSRPLATLPPPSSHRGSISHASVPGERDHFKRPLDNHNIDMVTTPNKKMRLSVDSIAGPQPSSVQVASRIQS